MIVTCPACATRYIVDPAAIGRTGRTVRCARCAKTWHQDPPPPEPITVAARSVETEPPPIQRPMDIPPPPVSDSGDDAMADEDEAIEREPMPAFIGRRERYSGNRLPAIHKPKPRVNWLLIGWVGLAATVIALAAILFFAREAVTEAWPATARLYEVLGLEAKAGGNGLEVRSVNSALTSNDGGPTLVIAGEIANVSGEARHVPPLRVLLRNAHNQTLKSWDFTAGRDQLLPGETAPFQTSIANPPPEATSARVEFPEE